MRSFFSSDSKKHCRFFACILLVSVSVLLFCSCAKKSGATHPADVTLVLDANGTYCITNAEGNTLEYENLDFSGDMTVLEQRISGVDVDTPSMYCTVPYSESYTVEFLDHGTFFNVLWDDTTFNKVKGTGIAKIEVTQEELWISGSSMDYAIRYHVDNAADHMLLVNGAAASTVTVTRGDLLTVCSDSTYSCTVKKLGGDAIAEQTYPAGAEAHISLERGTLSGNG